MKVAAFSFKGLLEFWWVNITITGFCGIARVFFLSRTINLKENSKEKTKPKQNQKNWTEIKPNRKNLFNYFGCLHHFSCDQDIVMVLLCSDVESKEFSLLVLNWFIYKHIHIQYILLMQYPREKKVAKQTFWCVCCQEMSWFIFHEHLQICICQIYFTKSLFSAKHILTPRAEHFRLTSRKGLMITWMSLQIPTLPFSAAQ